MLIVTTDELPGYEIRLVYGYVYGLTVRNAAQGSSFGVNPSAMIDTFSRARADATGRMMVSAQRYGANAIVGMRYEGTNVGSGPWSEICAYGTAVWVEPVTEWARRQYERKAQAGEVPPLPEPRDA